MRCKSTSSPGPLQSAAGNEAEALEEAAQAIEKVVLPTMKPIELLPRSAEVLAKQISLVEGSYKFATQVTKLPAAEGPTKKAACDFTCGHLDLNQTNISMPHCIYTANTVHFILCSPQIFRCTGSAYPWGSNNVRAALCHASGHTEHSVCSLQFFPSCYRITSSSE